jgi:hypothetical protein
MTTRDMAHRPEPPEPIHPARLLVDVAVLLFGMLAILLVVVVAGGPA